MNERDERARKSAALGVAGNHHDGELAAIADRELRVDLQAAWVALLALSVVAGHVDITGLKRRYVDQRPHADRPRARLGGVKGWQRVDIDEPIIRRKVYHRDKSVAVKGFTRTGDAFRATELARHVVQTNMSPERVKNMD
jgi:hypothetical protein